MFRKCFCICKSVTLQSWSFHGQEAKSHPYLAEPTSRPDLNFSIEGRNFLKYTNITPKIQNYLEANIKTRFKLLNRGKDFLEIYKSHSKNTKILGARHQDQIWSLADGSIEGRNFLKYTISKSLPKNQNIWRPTFKPDIKFC